MLIIWIILANFCKYKDYRLHLSQCNEMGVSNKNRTKHVYLRQWRDLLQYLFGQIGLKSEIENYLEIN